MTRSISSQLRQREPRVEDAKHLRWIRTLPCLITGRRGNIHAAHIRFGSLKWEKRSVGIGEKPSDRWAVPLHADIHVFGPDAQHRHGEETWWFAQGICPLTVADALYRESGNTEAAEGILRKTRETYDPLR